MESKDFLIEDKNGSLTPDVSRLEELSDEEFDKIYVAEMEQFVKNHGKKPICLRCSSEVESPKKLVRYLGKSLHYVCFRETYGWQRGGLEEKEKRYYDLVSEMVDNTATKPRD